MMKAKVSRDRVLTQDVYTDEILLRICLGVVPLLPARRICRDVITSQNSF